MNIDRVNISDLFKPSVQYRIPLFQRHYVWDRIKQWEPLWLDISQQTQVGTTMHFTGTTVIQQLQASPGVQIYDIIDGQQRLTTFQIILCAIRDICKKNGHTEIANEVCQYINNKSDEDELETEERYKIIPTKRNKVSFIALIDGDTKNSTGKVYSAYSYFRDKIQDHADIDPQKIKSLFEVIINNFGFVQIRISEADKPEKIFESLNARGEKLLEFDKLRNNLFLRARANRDHLYETYWEHFEDDYWDPGIPKNGTSYELFFQHFLIANLATENVKPEFTTYEREYKEKLKHEDKTVEDEFISLKGYSNVYCKMTDCNVGTLIGKRMEFYKIFELTTLHPFLLFVICDVGLGEAELERVFDILESYTLRRMLCCNGKGGLKGYNKFFARVIKHLQDDFSLDKFIQYLDDETSDTTNYPTDHQIRDALYTHFEPNLLNFPDRETIIFPGNQYMKAALSGLWVKTAGQIKRRLIRYILYRIEMEKQKNNKYSEKIAFEEALDLEHIMPQTWKEKWDLPINPKAVTLDQDAHKVIVNTNVQSERKFHHELFSNPNTEPTQDGLSKESYANAYKLTIARDALLENIGNLTLVNKSLNSRLGNRPFDMKKEALMDSNLILNREIREHEQWDINEIDTRSQKLIEDVRQIWKPLDWFRGE